MPEVDDTIHINSSLNVTSQVAFKLNFQTSGVKNSREYKAEFTADSASEFTINPKYGTLSPDDPSRYLSVNSET